MKTFSTNESWLSKMAKLLLRISLVYRPIAFGKRKINLRLLLVFPKKSGTRIRKDNFNGVDGEWISPLNAKPERLLLYFHGGGYTGGSARTHRALISHIAYACKASAFCVNYRLAPKYPYPAALDDAKQVWAAFSDTMNEKDIFLAGDSAGGGLCLALIHKLIQQKRALPGGAILISPWTDLSMSNPDTEIFQLKDPMLRIEDLKNYAR
ncbi:MAG: monoterpene epsilon-lactone hydrolase, partial [Limisphaerales bacterium]